MRKFILLSFLIVISPYFAFSQVGVAMPFLLEAPDARSSGMGETGTAIADDINASFWNPAGLGFLNQGEIIKGSRILYFENSDSYFLSMNKFTDDAFRLNETVGANFRGVGTFALDFNYQNIGDFTRTYEDGRVAGTFNANEFEIGLAYGRKINQNFSIGGKFKYLQSNIAAISSPNNLNSSASSVAFDFGFLWNPLFQGIEILDERFFTFGVNLRNLGPKLTYSNESDPLPTNLKIGFAFKFLNHKDHKLTIATDLSKVLIKRDSLGSDPLPKSLLTAWNNEGGMSTGFGGEYKYKNYFSLRSGFFYEPKNLGDRQYLTFGASAKIWIFRIDMAQILPVNGPNYLNSMTKLTFRVGG